MILVFGALRPTPCLEDFGPDPSPTEKAFTRGVPICVTTSKGVGAERHEVLGIVLEPTADPRVGPDSQGDIYTREAVAYACDNFAGGKGVQHKSFDLDGRARITRSWITLQDDFESFPDRPVYKGSWLMRWEITDDALWGSIQRGDITGFSIGGSAIRKPIT